MRPPVGQRQRLAEPLGLVVDAAWAYGVDVTPVTLGLRMHLRVPIDLRGRCQDEPGVLRQSEPEGVQGPDRPHLEGLDGELQVIDRRGGAREVQDQIDLSPDVDEVRHIGPNNPEPVVPDQVLDIGGRAREEVVQAQDVIPSGYQRIAKV